MKQNDSPFALAVRSQTGKTGLIICAVSLLIVIGMVIFRRVTGTEISMFLMMIPGFGSIAGMQTFANEANRIRMELEQQNKK